MIDNKYLTDFIARALAEDIGDGDHSGNSCIPEEARGKMQLLIKEDGVLAGLEVAQQVFAQLDANLTFEALMRDGQKVSVGDVAFVLSGSNRMMLRGERLALNLMQRMSGIATKTRQLTDKIAHTQTKILDTRKTTPNLRPLEKWAVRLGGGHNHRFGLFDMIMLKDNHVDFAGGIEPAIQKTLSYLKENQLELPIEVETRNLSEVKEVLRVGGVQRIMFDNFSPALISEALDLVQGKVETEASGGITEDTIVEYAETGVDFISVGALTHSVKGLDMSLKASV